MPAPDTDQGNTRFSAWRRALAASLVAAMLAGTAVAGPLEDGLAAYGRGDYAAALRLFLPLANEGNADAQYSLGVMYGNGRGLPQDYSEAVKWFRRAADQGQATSQYNLGVMYGKGQGAPQDYAEAAKWFRKAAEQGKTSAQYNLAYVYSIGQGVPQDYAEAAKWYRKAAEQGDADAQNRLGSMYGTGQGVPQDLVEAHKWFSLAASGDPATDAESRQDAARNRDLVAGKMTPEQIAEARKLAREWRPK
jgi:TPR repeat protein